MKGAAEERDSKVYGFGRKQVPFARQIKLARTKDSF